MTALGTIAVHIVVASGRNTLRLCLLHCPFLCKYCRIGHFTHFSTSRGFGLYACHGRSRRLGMHFVILASPCCCASLVTLIVLTPCVGNIAPCMFHRHLADGELAAAVRCSCCDGGDTCTHGLDGAILYGCYFGLIAAPGHHFVGGIGRLYRSSQGNAAVFP